MVVSNFNFIEKLNETEQALFTNTRIMYETGKGNHLVPVIAPDETFDATNIMCEPTVRKYWYFRRQHYLLLSTHQSQSHASGCHVTNTLCDAAGVKGNTSTTLMACLRGRRPLWRRAVDERLHPPSRGPVSRLQWNSRPTRALLLAVPSWTFWELWTTLYRAVVHDSTEFSFHCLYIKGRSWDSVLCSTSSL